MKPFWLLSVALLRAVTQAQFTFVPTNGAITITGYTGSGSAVTIPVTINGQTVAGIGTNAVENNAQRFYRVVPVN